MFGAHCILGLAFCVVFCGFGVLCGVVLSNLRSDWKDYTALSLALLINKDELEPSILAPCCMCFLRLYGNLHCKNDATQPPQVAWTMQDHAEPSIILFQSVACCVPVTFGRSFRSTFLDTQHQVVRSCCTRQAPRPPLVNVEGKVIYQALSQ